MVFNPDADTCRWIFAYGSLMWRPGFHFKQALPARLSGYHRRLSVYSNHYRGTEDKPGLVLGLDLGGSCAGLVYEVEATNWAEVLAYVRNREMIGGVYREIVKNIFVKNFAEPVKAVTYAVIRGHRQCAPPMPLPETLAYVEQGVGLAGTCADYVINTLAHLRELGLRDFELEKLEPYLKSRSSKLP